MSFSADWLQLRVAADSRSRAPHLEAALRDALSTYDPTGTGRIIDLDTSVFTAIAPLSAGAVSVVVSW